MHLKVLSYCDLDPVKQPLIRCKSWVHFLQEALLACLQMQILSKDVASKLSAVYRIACRQ